jgi:hypothetical protein
MLKYCAMRRTTIRGLFGSLQKSGWGLHSMNPVNQLPESALERVEQPAPSGALDRVIAWDAMARGAYAGVQLMY